MAILQDFTWIQYDTGFLTVSMEPSTPIGGRSIQFDWGKRFGGSGFFSRYSASGLDGLSGITITDSGLGRLNISINSGDANFAYGVYNYRVRLTDNPPVTITEGSILLEP